PLMMSARVAGVPMPLASFSLSRNPGSFTNRHEFCMASTSTTVAILMRRSDPLPTGREEENERCVDRGDAGALGVVAAGGKGADAPALYAGPGSGIGGSVSLGTA